MGARKNDYFGKTFQKDGRQTQITSYRYYIGDSSRNYHTFKDLICILQ